MQTGKAIQHAARLIREGELVAFPTETVYGLGANAFNPEAVANIFRLKERPAFDPLIVHIANLDQAVSLCKHFDDRIRLLAEKFWPGPLTILVEKNESVPDIVTSGLNTVGIRMPDHPLALQLISEAQTPIAAPSANKFGRISPTRAIHVASQLPEVPYIIDGGPTTVGIESSVIRLHDDGFVMLRPGAINADEIRQIIPESKFIQDEEDTFHSPGQIKSHYSPQKSMFLGNTNFSNSKLSKAGLIAWGTPEYASKFKKVEYLSKNRNPEEAAINLFNALHTMEAADVDFIVADTVPETGIGIAIMDRLRKAAYRHSNKAS
ncbi:L-threonylcarbamoyladenylate synthase [Marinilabilia salmonicolor]|uniref:Threonylcarbamoyl-AMP synthase n=1 Tax=Marinilabilia salmonicolor TaxID=989 RepID=A0A368V6E0_9BACT|nr:L-threonylcarbamoyladenylate synthase [Marinilabilia salmonicolor]RCW36678.1 L-threonylcarbamoyladenylate synthase [Marinilabilia salmonicolor]